MNSQTLILLFLLGAIFLFVGYFYTRRLQLKINKLLKVANRSEAALKIKGGEADQEKNRLFAILESMAEGVMVIDPAERVILANSALTKALDAKMNDVSNHYFWEVLRDPKINDMIKTGLGEQITVKKEHTVLLSNLTFQIQVSPIFGNQEFLGVVAVFHDVTQLKELEKLRSEFVANVSHELKTPLTSIMGFVETLKEGAINDPENRLKFLHIIEEHSLKLHELIEDLLLLSKVESGNEVLKKEKIDLEKLLQKLLSLFEKSIQAKKLKVSVEVSPKPFMAEVDPRIFEQALSNLLDNAIKYNEDHGQIIIRLVSDSKESKIEIVDSGIGIPEEDLSRIFERFYRVDRSRSRETGGTGLGLAIVKHIIERHGGRIFVKSAPQKGSIFTIILRHDFK